MRSLATILALLFALSVLGCARPESPGKTYEKAGVALDPSVEGNWPPNWASGDRSNSIFASFIRYAEGSGDWLILGHKGEAVYVRAANKDQMSVRFQQRSNKVETLKIPGEAEVLSLRQYARCRNLHFDAAKGILTMEEAKVRRNSGWQ